MFSVSAYNGIVKINNKAIDHEAKLESFQKCSPMTETELSRIKNWGTFKIKAANQSGSVLGMFEQETLNQAKNGVSIEEIYGLGTVTV